MSRKIFVVILSALGLFQLWNKSNLQEIISKSNLQISDYNLFTNEFRVSAILAGMVILLAIIFLTSSAGQGAAKGKHWQLVFFGVIAFTLVIVAGVNPQGNFPWNKRNQYIEMAARAQKPALYTALPKSPDVLVFGSSVSFFMPMEYFKEKWNLQGFNFSIDGGGVRDYVNLLNWMQTARADEKIPPVILVEVSNPSLAVGGLKKTPLEQLPSVETLDQKIEISWAAFSNALRMGQVSDAIFTVAIVENGRWESAGKLLSDGTIKLKTEKMSSSKYQNSVENNLVVADLLFTCNRLNKEGMRSMERLIELSHEHQFSLVIYRPPINDDLYQFANHEREKYAACGRLFDEFMEEVAAENSNVFFRSLSQYEEISSKGKEFYRDTHHLNSKGQMLLLDALNKEIFSAIQWAKENR